MKIYVGNMAYDVTEDELAAEFGVYGKVDSVIIPSDKISGRPKGFAFVEMSAKAEADAAIAGLNGKMMKERTLTGRAAATATTGADGRAAAAAGAALGAENPADFSQTGRLRMSANTVPEAANLLQIGHA
jgi:hypothetical protein